MSHDLVAIPEYDGRYAVSRDGAVFSHVSKKYLRPIKHPLGYQAVNLTLRDGKGGKKRRLIHVLVAEAYIPNPEAKDTVNHKNGVKTDNRVENLEWATHSENHAHAYRELGRKAHTATLRDSSKPCVMFQGDKSMRFTSARAAAHSLGISEKGVARACRGERKSYAGRVWAYL